MIDTRYFTLIVIGDALASLIVTRSDWLDSCQWTERKIQGKIIGKERSPKGQLNCQRNSEF